VTRAPHDTDLVVHTASGTVRVPTTGEPEHDALLERLARKGGPVTRADGTVTPQETDQAELDMRAALRGGS
jgi:hypothetical protein